MFYKLLGTYSCSISNLILIQCLIGNWERIPYNCRLHDLF